MEHIFFLALLAVVGLIRWLSQVAEERKNKEAAKRTAGPAPNAPIQRAQPDTEAERVRKFMEALGVPTTSAPPPPPPQQPAPPPPRKPKVMPVDPFPVPRPFRTERLPVPTAAPPASPPPLPPPPHAVPTVTSAPPPLPSPARKRVVEVDPYDVDRQIGDEDESLVQPGQLAKGRAGAARGLATRLATSQGLREAIVLREIFGPPRSMQPLDLTRPN